MKLSKKEKSWIMYDWANSAYSLAITTAILPVFFKSTAAAGIVEDVATARLAFANSIASFIIAVLGPILGTIADYKGYKKRFFSVFLLLGIFATAMLATVNEGDWLKCLIIYGITSLGFAGANIFYDSFLTDVTSLERMDRVSAAGYGYGYIGSTIPCVISIGIILKPEIFGIDTLLATKIAFLITAFWWFAFSIPFLRNIEQVYGIDIEPKPVRQSFKRLLKTLKNIRMYKHIFMFLIAYFFYIDGVDTIIKMSSSYGMDVGLDGNSLLIVLLLMQIVMFPCALAFGKYAMKFSSKRMILFGILIYVIVTVMAFFMSRLWHFILMASLVALAQGGIQALSRSYFGKIIPKNNSNEFFGFYNILGKFAAVLGPSILGGITLLTGKSKYGVLGITLLFIIGGIILLFLPKPEKAKSV